MYIPWLFATRRRTAAAADACLSAMKFHFQMRGNDNFTAYRTMCVITIVFHAVIFFLIIIIFSLFSKYNCSIPHHQVFFFY